MRRLAACLPEQTRHANRPPDRDPGERPRRAPRPARTRRRSRRGVGRRLRPALRAPPRPTRRSRGRAAERGVRRQAGAHRHPRSSPRPGPRCVWRARARVSKRLDDGPGSSRRCSPPRSVTVELTDRPAATWGRRLWLGENRAGLPHRDPDATAAPLLAAGNPGPAARKAPTRPRLAEGPPRGSPASRKPARPSTPFHCHRRTVRCSSPPDTTARDPRASAASGPSPAAAGCAGERAVRNPGVVRRAPASGTAAREPRRPDSGGANAPDWSIRRNSHRSS